MGLALGRQKAMRCAPWFIDDRLVSEREDLFAHYAGQDQGQRLLRFAHNRLELLRTRELLQRQLPLPLAAVLDETVRNRRCGTCWTVPL